MVLAILIVICFVLFILTFRPPTPHVSRLFFFLAFLGVTAVLAYNFAVKVLHWNPNPSRVSLANRLTDNKLVDLAGVAPGVFDLNYIHRIDTDWEQGEKNKNLLPNEEWLVFYQYDVINAANPAARTGPFGAAIYEHDLCRPPAVLSYELIPASYDYLGQDNAAVTVANIIPYVDPLSVLDGVSQDRPEVIISGYTRGAQTDLHIFRQTGTALDCNQRQQWLASHPGEPFPNPVRYASIGSFRGSYAVVLAGNDVTVIDSAGFERSQFTVKREYLPQNGSYYKPGTEVLLDPKQYRLGFGPGKPDVIPQVYYPEKAVLAFYLDLGNDPAKLAEAKSYLSQQAQSTYDINTDPFGLSTDPNSVARARSKLARVLVWELGYTPDPLAERNHQPRQITVRVVGVDQNGNVDTAHPCEVTWTVLGIPKSGALPYNCEWALDHYQSTCQP